MPARTRRQLTSVGSGHFCPPEDISMETLDQCPRQARHHDVKLQTLRPPSRCRLRRQLPFQGHMCGDIVLPTRSALIRPLCPLSQ